MGLKSILSLSLHGQGFHGRASVQDVELSKGCIQTRLLADVASIRNRHKKETIGALLQTEKLKQHVAVVKYAELVLVESIEFYNPRTEAQAFRIEVCPLPTCIWRHSMYFSGSKHACLNVQQCFMLNMVSAITPVRNKELCTISPKLSKPCVFLYRQNLGKTQYVSLEGCR
jgi:hypothetical protein